MPTYLFLDTEWADPQGHSLVSLALVSEDGTQEFYAEIDPLPSIATEFVRETVYPLLDRGAVALSKIAFTTRLRSFLASVPEPCLLADYPNDLALTKTALAGFDLDDETAHECGPIPRLIMSQMLKDGITQLVLEDYFRAHPDAARRRHHALVDAKALCATWRALTGRDQCSWSPALDFQRMNAP
jgi:hypothetical protein